MESNLIGKTLNRGFIYFQDDNIVMQFIPILLALFYGFDHRSFDSMSHSVLGKLFVVVVILFYAKINKIYGTLACVIAVFYYHLNDKTIENFSAEIDKKMLLAKDKFTKEKCKNGILMHNGLEVKTEMTSHVYPEIHYENDTPCNPCDKACYFDILECKMTTEDELKTPKNSRDFFADVSDSLSKVFT
jgi:hypothetical protein